MWFFYLNSSLAVLATALVVLSKNAIHALLYFIASLIFLAITIYTIGSPFAAVLEVIIYAGAIMTLFIFIVMLLNLRVSLTKAKTLGPILLMLVILIELLLMLSKTKMDKGHSHLISTKEVAELLFTQYAIGVELASLLLLAGLVGAYHLAAKEKK